LPDFPSLDEVTQKESKNETAEKLSLPGGW
jgi:hypothetical protein